MDATREINEVQRILYTINRLVVIAITEERKRAEILNELDRLDEIIEDIRDEMLDACRPK